MEKQLSCLHGGKKPVRHLLPTISEEVEDAPLQKRLVKTEENEAKIIQLKTSIDKCSHSTTRNKGVMQCQETERKTVLFRHLDDTFTDDRCPLCAEHQQRMPKLFVQTEKQKDMNEAKVLFPDFFPQVALQETCEESSWKARPTMEEIFSGQHNALLSVKSGLHHDTNFEYWKIYQLSF